LSNTKIYKSVKIEDEVYLKLQYLKKKHKCSSLSEVINKLTEGK
jgi:predicted CopG family antitoxin